MDARSVSSIIAKFSAKFCNELEKDKNIVSSPLSAEYVLGLLALGTRDPAHSELLEALGVPDDNAIRSVFSSVSSTFKAVKGVTLNVANKVYVKEGDYEIQPALKEDSIKVFDAAFEKINFANSAAAANTINGWVENKTNNKIKKLLPEDCFSEDTRVVLVNALYFKGSWKKKFDASLTSPKPFHVSTTTTVDVPMMYKDAEFRYGESQELNAQLLELPYEGDDSSLIIVLPKEIDGLNTILNKLASGHDLTVELEKMFSTKVNVIIPKFKIETEIDLNSLLPKLGISSIFKYHNTGIDKMLTNNEELSVSKAVQKAFIEINEEGAEAAAATGVVMMLRCARPVAPPVPFVADRPFLFTIAGPDRATLFVGVYRG